MSEGNIFLQPGYLMPSISFYLEGIKKTCFKEKLTPFLKKTSVFCFSLTRKWPIFLLALHNNYSTKNGIIAKSKIK